MGVRFRLSTSTASLNASTRLLTLPISGLASLVTAHIVLTSVGPNLLGVVALISTLPALVPFIDMGVGATVATAVGDGRVDAGERRRIIGVSAFLLTQIATIFIVLLTALTAVGFPWNNALGLAANDVPHLGADLVIMSTLLGLGLPPSLGYRVLLGADAYWIAQLVQLVTPLVSLAATAVAVSYGNIDAMILAPVFGQSIASWISVPVGLRRIGTSLRSVLAEVRPGTAAVRAKIRSAAAPMIAVSVGLPIAFQTDRVILSHRSSGASLTAYAAVALLYAPVLSVVTSAGFALWPRFAASRTDPLLAHAQFERAMRTFGLAGICAGVSLVLFGPLVTHVWAGRNLAHEWVWVAAGVLLIAQAAQMPAGMFLMDPAGLRIQALCVGAMVVLNLILSWFLAPSLSAAGPLLASAVAVVVCQVIPGVIVVRKRRAIG